MIYPGQLAMVIICPDGLDGNYSPIIESPKENITKATIGNWILGTSRLIK